jgi:hypothetical protein
MYKNKRNMDEERRGTDGLCARGNLGVSDGLVGDKSSTQARHFVTSLRNMKVREFDGKP